MAKVQRTQQNHDADLALQGLRRVLQAEINQDGLTVYRERTIKIDDHAKNKTPWWKQNKRK